MKIFLFVFLIGSVIINAKASLHYFEKGAPILSSEFNKNFNYIKNLLKIRNKEIQFSQINPLDIISKEFLNNELLKISEFVPSPTIIDDNIQSSTLNTIFQNIESNIDLISYDLQVSQNNTKTIDLSSNNIDFPTSYSVVSPPNKGTLSINSTNISYTPNLNILGTDSFIIKATSGNIEDKEVLFSVSIDGEGLIIANGSRTYYDGSLAKSCNEYKVNVSGKRKYSGAIGDGLYRIQIPETGLSQVVYCDMSSDSGGWTLIAAGGSACTNFVLKSDSQPLYPSHAQYGSNCGYLNRTVVRNVAQVSTDVRLRSSGNNPSQINSTGIKPINSLRLNTNWHYDNAHLQFSSGFSWSWSCAVNAGGWPDMFHACNNANGVHWLASTKHSRIYGTPDAYTSTWIK